ncbi:helix-turn-helix domain-containing protein [Sphingomonas endolithica]|uniref:helix-turn-helix domain-containing protein n=1 Tax=Sphingomonas endolithica TaxID=2972485 RepID=UPI0021AF835A|nr:helix-turn-helix domain-containing protein [Sphingomonas sp. ZFBP2030]
MTDPVPAEDATLFPKTAGERLREAREAQGLSLSEIAARTRVPLRQLEAIETNNFTGLPSVTYAVGFAKAYARAVGMDEVAIAREVRSQNDLGVQRTEYEQYEIKEPSRTPSGGVVLATLAVLAVLLIAMALWFGTNLFRGQEEAAPTAVTTNEFAPPEQSAAPAPVAPQGGQVVLTATDEVWLRVYDATGKTLFQNTLKSGDRYEVPADANGPLINVGRPDKLQVTINGSAVPPLGSGRVAIKDVGISATALQARSATGAPAAAPIVPAATTAQQGARTSSDSRSTVPAAFRNGQSTTTAPSDSAPVVTRPGGGSPAEVAPVPAPGAAPATAP